MKKTKNKRSQQKPSRHQKSQQESKNFFSSKNSAQKTSRTHSSEPLVGKIKRHPDGFGFFIPDDPEHPDVYIPKHGMTGIMTGDRITIKAYPEGHGDDRYRGDVINILQRGTTRVVGKFQSSGSSGMIKDEGKGWGQDLSIASSDYLSAKNGDLVTVEILEYPDEGKTFRGKVIQVLGDINDPMNDIKRVIAAQNIPDEFPKEVIAQSKTFGSVPTEEDFKKRTDLRNLPLITIDGATAKDFDDAILTEMTSRGFKLYVAIADVSHYVKPETPMDEEAYMRGNSVYFPNFVVPMLPEALSNGLCSLNPHVPRLCLVAEMDFDFQGHRHDARFYEAVMISKARMTYGEAQEIVDGAEVNKPEVKEMAKVKENILRSADLAKLLMANRYKAGSLDLEIPETELLIDASGTPIDVIRSERLFSHRLIEEMMLAANVAVAEFLSACEIPAIYRVHDNPNPQALTILEKYLSLFGGHVKLDAASLPERGKNSQGTSLTGSKSLPPGRLQKKLTKALEEFKDKPEGQILHILTLRSMAQAKYSTHNIGHFGLGFENYTHFTSPIRRYPDLIVHRLLKSQILSHSDYQKMSEDDLSSAGTMLSSCEQKAAKSERQIKAIKKARFLQKFLGEEFEGIISSVTRFGVFVLLREYDVDGLIKIDSLSEDSGDRFVYDEENLRLVAKRSGFSFNIGDKVKVQVESADIELGQVNFGLVEKLASAHEDVRIEKSAQKQQKADHRKSRREKIPTKKERPSKVADKKVARDTQKISLRLRHQTETPKQERPQFKQETSRSEKPRFSSSFSGGAHNNSDSAKSASSGKSRRDLILQMLDEKIAARGHSGRSEDDSRRDSHSSYKDSGKNSKGKNRAKDKPQSARSNFKKRR